MADLITHSLTFSKESEIDFFIKPLFIENDLRDIITIRTDIKSSEKLDFVDNLEKITRKTAKGTAFISSTGVEITQKTLTVEDAKAQVNQNGKAFLNQVKQVALKTGFSENDISQTLFEEIVLTIFMDGLKADLQRQLWFGDKAKEVITAGVPTPVIDVDYNIYKGFWKRILDDEGIVDGIPTAQFIDINATEFVNTVAIKQVDTNTLTGTSGTADITVNGTAFLATFNTSLTQTAADFVTTHAATILARHGNIVVTSSGADIIFTAGIAGLAQTVSNAINATGNLAGTTAATTVNVKTGTLKDDAAVAIFTSLYKAMPAELKQRKTDLKFLATATIVDNYKDTMESPTAGSDSSYNAVIDGIRRLAYRNIPITEMLDWDKRIELDFADQQPHRILLLISENLVFGTDGESDDRDIESFFDRVEQDNIFRVEYKAGTQYVHPNYIIIGIG